MMSFKKEHRLNNNKHMKQILTLLTLSLLISGYAFSQKSSIEAEGHSPLFKRNIDSSDMKMEALQNAQLNAIKIYGGYITYGSGTNSKNHIEKTLQNKKSKTSAQFSSNGVKITSRTINAIVKSNGKINYEIKKYGRKKRVIATGTFIVDMEKTGNLINSFLTADGEKILVEIYDSSKCVHSAAPKIRAYFNKNQINFKFADKGMVFITTKAFVINVYSDHVDILKKQIQINAKVNTECKFPKYENGPIIKTFLYKSCKDFATKANNSAEDNSVSNKLLEDIMNEIYKLYLSNKINTIN